MRPLQCGRFDAQLSSRLSYARLDFSAASSSAEEAENAGRPAGERFAPVEASTIIPPIPWRTQNGTAGQSRPIPLSSPRGSLGRSSHAYWQSVLQILTSGSPWLRRLPLAAAVGSMGTARAVP